MRKPPSLGESLRALREQRGLTQTEVAQAMGTTQPVISRMEKQWEDVSLKSLRGYVQALGAELECSAVWGRDGSQSVVSMRII